MPVHTDGVNRPSNLCSKRGWPINIISVRWSAVQRYFSALWVIPSDQQVVCAPVNNHEELQHSLNLQVLRLICRSSFFIVNVGIYFQKQIAFYWGNAIHTSVTFQVCKNDAVLCFWVYLNGLWVFVFGGGCHRRLTTITTHSPANDQLVHWVVGWWDVCVTFRNLASTWPLPPARFLTLSRMKRRLRQQAVSFMPVLRVRASLSARPGSGSSKPFTVKRPEEDWEPPLFHSCQPYICFFLLASLMYSLSVSHSLFLFIAVS